ncbi:bile acid:sodium symporter family protein [Alkanindiges sp. WGS2144]|uniref:bile acid:sodium symporter family protein n=1 Tax=Alkanindiges sp. WGS2144 TaxID=3366808 RepID=UPI0037526368
MESGLMVQLLPLALAVVMMGLGLELSLKDFSRVAQHPKAVVIALICQLVILTGLAFVITQILNLSPLLALGMMLLAASPGGATANLYSFLFRGDVALNITLTAINSILAVFTLPLIVNWASRYFLNSDEQLGLQFSKVLQVFAIVILPVAIGMVVRKYAPVFARHMDKPVRVFSVVLLALIILGALLKEKANLMQYMLDVGIATSMFCILSLCVGYFVPRLFGISEAQARASAFEIGIHNGTLALTIALSLMNNMTVAIPAAIYSVIMFIFAAAFGFIISRNDASKKSAT